MTKRKRITYRLNDDLYQKLEQQSEKYNVSVNAVINHILEQYFSYLKQNPNLNIWKCFETLKEEV